MKALILAAGYGIRLYPLTLNQPKPLIKVGGKAIIEHILQKIDEIDEIDEIYVVTNNKFFPHFTEWSDNLKTSKTIKIINDKTTSNEDRLGAIGDINFVVKKETIEDDLLVIGGDNLFEMSLKEFTEFSKNKAVIVAYDVHNLELAKLLGIISIDNNNKITDFEEKPEKPKSTLASTCIYFFPLHILKEMDAYIKEGNPTDKSGHFIQWLYKKTDVHSFVTKEEWFDIGSKEQLEEANLKYNGI